jgi:hypothetical protein
MSASKMLLIIEHGSNTDFAASSALTTEPASMTLAAGRQIELHLAAFAIGA